MLKLAVIGAGGRGEISKLAHKPDEGSSLIALCDTREEAFACYTELLGDQVDTYSDYREVLKRDDIDAVIIATPDDLHEEHAIAALQAGKGVYLEKPLAITIEGCDRILQTAKDTGMKLYVGHNMRFFPVMQKMREIIESGRIGEVQAIWCRHFIAYGGDAYFKDWHSERKHTTGLLLQKGAHDIDVIHYLAGSHTVRTVGMGMLSVYDKVEDRRSADEPGDARIDESNWPPLSQTGISPVIDVEDHSMVMMQLASGAQASYMQCHYSPDDVRNYTVIGTKGRIENIGDHSTEEKIAKVRVWESRKGFSEFGDEEIALPAKDGTHGGADPMILDDFVRYMKTGERIGAEPWDARQAVAVGCLASESLRNGNVPKDVPGFGG
ncbi:Putative oxidoreductase YteT precursor [Poriferisphaera corsica]|uniref:Oxidoreductase YteT n=1 Tax=Poriferisphaera corsica TaxID=2528020 RepID=A0A517YYN2_9BACT|nr:Gfo/Idh/MocA family oxidoreductase [Poriferisphaera corsica]QDU35344.1 Putative oxidoreductase YteT precursor [Poriferisphaera corsica]